MMMRIFFGFYLCTYNGYFFDLMIDEFYFSMSVQIQSLFVALMNHLKDVTSLRI